jgi:hypothetical protein
MVFTEQYPPALVLLLLSLPWRWRRFQNRFEDGFMANPLFFQPTVLFLPDYSDLCGPVFRNHSSSDIMVFEFVI